MPIITKELALKISNKLGANIKKRKSKAHDIACVFHGGKLITQFGIRRGSKKGLGHDHIASQIFLSPRQARLLGECPLSREEWIDIAQGKGKL